MDKGAMLLAFNLLHFFKGLVNIFYENDVCSIRLASSYASGIR